MWTESPAQSEWAAEILNELIASLPPVRIGLHVCGGNPRRKRVYFTRYTDLAPAFRKVHIQEVLLEHCTLGYNLMDLWKLWDFKGDLGIGVIDQRSDEIETPQVIRDRLRPALEYFPPSRLLLTSECGFGHVPIDITRAKLNVLTRTAKELARAGSV
jgi:5-methyltetrahydropteroyltriglutamate--homocysteine methyltransferase